MAARGGRVDRGPQPVGESGCRPLASGATARESINEWGLRGHYPALDDIDIVTLGGSATDQRYITDGSTWQDVIVREFEKEGRRVSVVNAGVDGQSTYGHIKDFEWWFPTLPDFKPRYVLFYVAGNDIFKEPGGDFDDLVNDVKPNWKTHIRERSAMKAAAAAKSAPKKKK